MDFYYIKHESNITIASVWVSGGSDKDGHKKKGINQILSSLIIRGCKDFDNFKLSNYINSYGADLNCETYEDGILLSIKSTKSYFKEVYPILKLIIDKPILSKEQFKICQHNSINNIKKSKENPFNIAFDNWRKLVYKNHPYAFNIGGYIEDIKNINYGDILDEYDNFKKRKKILLSNYFYQNMFNINSLISNKTYDKKLIYQEKDFNEYKNKCILHHQNSNQIIFLIGNKTCSYSDNDFINLKILEAYLAFGMSSKLFRVFREKNGLTYDVGVFNPLRKSASPFVIYLSSSHKNCIKTFNHLLKLWEQITSKPLSQEELDLAKVKLNTSILLSSQTTEEIINRKVQLLGLNADLKLEEKFFKRISTVGAEEILETSQKYLLNPFLSLCGKDYFCNQINKIWKNNF